MMKKLKRVTAAAVLGLCAAGAWAQSELIVSQYIHNGFAANPAFAGSRECLSIGGGFRKQWTMIENTPQSALLTAHTPLRDEKLTLGAMLYQHSIHESLSIGLTGAIGYRTNLTQDTRLGLSLQPGIAMRSRDWSRVRTMDDQDAVFEEKDTGVAPLLGFGIAYYGKKFFAGLSTPSLIVCDDFEFSKPAFSLADATYIAMGGYWFDVHPKIAVQPSLFADISKAAGAAAMLSVSGIYDERVWLTAALRTTQELTVGAAYKPSVRMKVAYSYTLTIGELQGYNNGSHELSLQYDFVYKVKTVGHRFY